MKVRVLTRLRDELRARPRPFGADDVGALSARHDEGRVVIGGDDDLTLSELEQRGVRAPYAEITSGTYVAVPGREARVALLTRARALGDRVVLHVHVGDPPGGASRVARVVVDGPRAIVERALAPFGVPSPLPSAGDRHDGGRFTHVFPDEEPLLFEIADAGLAVASREGERFELAPGPRGDDDAEPLAREIARAARLVGVAERARNASSPEEAVRAMRERGRSMPVRGPIARARLRRAIGWVDALHPRGPNCYRRTLLELALDGGAAEETLVFGLDVGETGHVAFKGREALAFDVVFELAP